MLVCFGDEYTAFSKTIITKAGNATINVLPENALEMPVSMFCRIVYFRNGPAENLANMK